MAQIKMLLEQDIQVSDEEVKAYAEYLGMHLEFERDLIHIAREGLLAKLPEGWRACCQEDRPEDIFYFDTATGVSTWNHPMDSITEKKLQEARDAQPKKVATLTVLTMPHGVGVQAMSMAGELLATAPLEPGDSYGVVEDKLRAQISVPEKSVLRFALDATLIDYQSRAMAATDVLNCGMEA